MRKFDINKTITKTYEIIWLNFNKQNKSIEAEYKLSFSDGSFTKSEYLRVKPITDNEFDFYAQLKPNLESVNLNMLDFFEALIYSRIHESDPELPLSDNDNRTISFVNTLLSIPQPDNDQTE